MHDLWLAGGLAIVLAGFAWFISNRRARQTAVGRLAQPFLEDDQYEESVQTAGFAPKSTWIAYALVVVLGLSLWLFAEWQQIFCLALVLVGWVLVSIAISTITKKRGLHLEILLTEAIDLIVGSLHAGAGMLDSLDNAAREAREPLGGHLRDLVGQIRLGSTAHEALEDLYRKIPLESYRLFAFTLSVHEETGGSLAPTLSMVARSIRDNIDLRGRVNAETAQAQFSVFGIIFITYGIAFVTWQTHPDRVEGFFADEQGMRVIAAALVMQAVGLFWMTRLTRIRY
ncbi:MAG: tight adherence protein B [Planctomycetota bacterium]|jgi:tight adherence protein B